MNKVGASWDGAQTLSSTV